MTPGDPDFSSIDRVNNAWQLYLISNSKVYSTLREDTLILFKANTQSNWGTYQTISRKLKVAGEYFHGPKQLTKLKSKGIAF